MKQTMANCCAQTDPAMHFHASRHVVQRDSDWCSLKDIRDVKVMRQEQTKFGSAETVATVELEQVNSCVQESPNKASIHRYDHQ